MNSAILLVDDDMDDAALVCEAFSKVGAGEHLRHVKDGEAALRYLQGTDEYADRSCFPLPSLVILDLRLPKITGLEVLKWIRQQPSLRAVIVVVLTGLELDGEIQRAYLLGANSVLFKGTTEAQLDAKVKALKGYWLGENQRAA